MTYDPPTAEDAAIYAKAIQSVALPVLVDPDQRMLTDTGWDGAGMPGLCVLAPDMTMLDCWSGMDDARAVAAIEAHAAAN